MTAAGVSVLVAAQGFHAADYIAMLDDERAGFPSLRTIVLLGEGELPGWAISWDSFVGSASAIATQALRDREATLDPDDPINIQFTSGTTGAPKGATLTHHNVLNNGALVGARLRYVAGDRVCVPVPFYHCFGMVLGNLACLAHGATVVLPGSRSTRPSASARSRPSGARASTASPRCSSRCSRTPDFDGYDLSSLRTGVMAGAPCSDRGDAHGDRSDACP